MEELNKRKNKYIALQVFAIFTGIIAGICYLSVRVSQEPLTVILMFLFGATAIILGVVAKNGINQVSLEFKQTYIQPKIEEIIPGANYFPEQGITEDQIRYSKVTKLYSIYKSEDLIEGIIHDVHFQFSDVHIINREKRGKTVVNVTKFQGRVYKFAFNKRFKANVLLIQPGNYLPLSGLQKVKMESIDFNSELKVYCTDEHTVFYLLTPHLMEKLLELDTKYQDQISFSFIDDLLYIAIDSRTDSFDVRDAGTISLQDVKKAESELNRIIEFVEFLQLENDLFLPVE